MSNQRRHDKLIDIISKELQKRGWNPRLIETNKEYVKGRHAGEIDLIARQGRYALACEMKCSKNNKSRGKAIKQLERMEKHYFNRNERLFKLYITYKGKHGDEYNIEWIR